MFIYIYRTVIVNSLKTDSATALTNIDNKYSWHLETPCSVGQQKTKWNQNLHKQLNSHCEHLKYKIIIKIIHIMIYENRGCAWLFEFLFLQIS